MSNLESWFWGGGRIARQAYWLALAALVATMWLVETMARTLASAYAPLIGFAGVAYLIGGATNAWVSTCVVTRRLHDVGRSGWWQLAPLIIATAGLAVAEPAWADALGVGQTGSALGLLVAIATYLGFLAILGCIPSAGPNRFSRPVPA